MCISLVLIDFLFFCFFFDFAVNHNRCDADPAALARYVLALLKKDKPVKDLQQCMNEQLDVFLGAETRPFLMRLFDVIESEEYLQTPIAINNDVSIPVAAAPIEQQQNIPASSVAAAPTSLLHESHAAVSELNSTTGLLIDAPRQPVTSRLGHREHNTAIDNNDSDHVNSSPLGTSITKLRDVSPISPVKHGNDNEHHRKEQRRRSARSRSRSRSPRRRNDREKYNSRGHSYRNKSPSSNDRAPNAFRRNSGHEPNKYHKRSVSPTDDDCQGTRSLSPVPKKNDRCRDFDEKGYCMRGETCPWDHGVNPVVLEDINNPTLMTIQGPHLRSTAEYNPDSPEIWTQSGSFINGPSRGGGAGGAGVPPNGAAALNPFQRLPPTTAAYRVAPPFPFPPNAATTPLQRELISVPVVEANSGGDISAVQKRRYEPEDTVAVAEGPTKRKVPINSRLGPPNRIGLQSNCSLELRKVPRGLNSIAHLNNHFCKFGKIVNIQVTYEGDPEAAIVTFSTHAEANVAYRSTEAVLNNRFIKVFWHTPGSGGGAVDGNHNATPNANSNAGGAPNAKDENITNNFSRKSNQYSLNNTVPANPTPASTEFTKNNVNSVANAANNPTNGPAAFSKANTAPTVIPPASALTTNRNRSSRITRAAPEAIRKKKEEQVKAAVQLAHGLHKRKHELLQGYLKQMKTCLELVEKMDSSDPQRTNLLETVKSLQNNIDKLNKEIASDQAQITAQIQPVQPQVATANHPFRKSKELQKKELLDIELELIAQQQDGNDTTDIQKRLEELQKSLGTAVPKQPTYPVTRSARVRPAPPGSTSFDRRPTTILVAGFSPDECDALLGHFKVRFSSSFSILMGFLSLFS